MASFCFVLVRYCISVGIFSQLGGDYFFGVGDEGAAMDRDHSKSNDFRRTSPFGSINFELSGMPTVAGTVSAKVALFPFFPMEAYP